MKQNQTPEQVATFRYGLIAHIVSRQSQLALGELKKYFEQLSSQSFEIPGQTNRTLSVRTLEHYLSQYRKYG